MTRCIWSPKPWLVSQKGLLVAFCGFLAKGCHYPKIDLCEKIPISRRACSPYRPAGRFWVVVLADVALESLEREEWGTCSFWNVADR